MSAEIFDKVRGVLNAIQDEKIENGQELETFRIKYLGSKSEVKLLFGKIKNIQNDRKRINQ